MAQPDLAQRLIDLIDAQAEGDLPDPLADVPEILAETLKRLAVSSGAGAAARALIGDRRAEISALEAVLSDQTSRDRLFEFFAIKALGPTRFRMTVLNRWQEHLAAYAEVPTTPDDDGLLIHDLRFANRDVRFRADWANPISQFFEAQYFYAREGVTIRPEAGDTVLDFGAGAGDAVLTFAAAVGPEGRVLAIEPTPSELVLQARNLALNPELAARVTPVAAAVSDQAGQTVSLAGSASGSHVAGTAGETDGPHAVTTTLDALVRQENLDRVDFLKFDIEGMELQALQGGIETLTRFRPKLAVCVYHGWQIFDVIPWLKAHLTGYSFHLENHAPVTWETVLYAKPDG